MLTVDQMTGPQMSPPNGPHQTVFRPNVFWPNISRQNVFRTNDFRPKALEPFNIFKIVFVALKAEMQQKILGSNFQSAKLQGNPYLKGGLSTIDLLVLTSLDQLILY